MFFSKKRNYFRQNFWENNKNHFFKKLVRINGSIIIIVWPCRNLQIFMVFIWMWYSDKMLRKITKKIPKWYKYLSWRWSRDRSTPDHMTSVTSRGSILKPKDCNRNDSESSDRLLSVVRWTAWDSEIHTFSADALYIRTRLAMRLTTRLATR